MKAIAGTALCALLLMAAACSFDDPNEQQATAPAFLMPQCSPGDPHCQLTEPPRLDERPGPGAE
ncbi:MAG TPA: hypothetical protein VGL83_06980 [Stellaceae bacterium]|jgi:hypothetical protein